MTPPDGTSDGGERPISAEEADNLRRSKRKIRNDDGAEAAQVNKKPNETLDDGKEHPPIRRSYASMFKGLDFVYSMSSDSKDEDDSSDSKVDSDYGTDFEYSDREDEVRGSVNWKA
ncbi:hypothetical protein PIB30_073000 [Stylosanthes scabra]|uniref:Uncharacterized protein n=1 Tax=Stylosanthes scabra TaxID=79078 RepID=A0ABU6QQE2_9FABA|nr:hypothetical protein [Stylosanthes scabra]